jgi:hypothetical protein
VLLALDDRALGEDVARRLAALGHAPELREPLEATPEAGEVPAVVLVDADHAAFDLPVFAAAWARAQPPPLLMVMTGSAEGRATAERVGATVLGKPMAPERVAHEVGRIAEVSQVTPLPTRKLPRGAMTATTAGALAAIGLVAGGLPEDEAAAIVAGSRRVDLAVVREALRPLQGQYLTPLPLLDTLCARRALTDAEARFAIHVVDGARTLRWLVDRGGIGQEAAARLCWALVCGNAVIATTEPRLDAPHPLGRMAARLRAHLGARYARVRGATPFQVLEVDDDCRVEEAERAAQALALRFAPERRFGVDLAELEPLADALWKQVLDARATLADPERRRAFDAFRVRVAPDEARQRRLAHEEAEESFVRGQRALAAGDAFKAVSELAAAARRCPDEPSYDAWAAWARVLAERARGGDVARSAARERQAAEESLLGRRPRPRALLALAHICEAAGDLHFAKLHLQEVLALDPRAAAARDALSRLGDGVNRW